MFHRVATARALVLLVCLVSVTVQAAERFHAVGPSSPEEMPPHQHGVVTVHFDRLPTSMRFNAPAYPCLVTENGIQYSSGFAETYDPRLGPIAMETSFEPGFDDDNLYARLWVESQNDARIVVLVRGALVCDEEKRIAHDDIPCDSPHGKGDWVDESYYIYPDGVHTRHVKIYKGLASRSLPFGSDRQPPRVIHEFMEAMVLGTKGRMPQDDIENDAVTLNRTVGDYSEDVIPEGKAKTFSFAPYPRDFGEFSNANILVVNLKSRFKPFTIAMPHGVRTQPYKRDNPLVDGFQVWEPGEHRSYTVPFGHIINYGHYRKTEKTIEQVYLSGMVESKDPKKELVPLAWSWIVPSKVSLERDEPSYTKQFYDPTLKAYVFDWKPTSHELSFDSIADPDSYGVPSTIVNPVLIVKGWGKKAPALEIDDKPAKPGDQFRFGYESHDGGTNLVLWLNLNSEEPVNVSLRPLDQ